MHDFQTNLGIGLKESVNGILLEDGESLADNVHHFISDEGGAYYVVTRKIINSGGKNVVPISKSHQRSEMSALSMCSASFNSTFHSLDTIGSPIDDQFYQSLLV